MADDSIVKKIPLTQGKFVTVDADDFDFLNQWKWYAWKDGERNCYARKHERLPDGKGIKVYMHRLIMSAPKGKDVDHINHNGLDNRKCNLRVCDRFENNGNSRKRKNTSSVYKGVYWSKHEQKWHASIRVNKRKVSLRYHSLEIDAALAYNKAAKELFGEFALLNEILI